MCSPAVTNGAPSGSFVAAGEHMSYQLALGLTVAHACGSSNTASVDAVSCASVADPHDEDGDGIYDACDNCPATANATQSDLGELGAGGFADRVGDGCDPRPTIAGDQLRSFYSFASDTQASAWTGTGWTISGDAVHASGA